MNKKQRLSISYFLSRSLFLGVGISNIFNIAGKDSWLSIIIGTILGLLIINLISYVSNTNKQFSNWIQQQKTFIYITKFIYILFLITLIIINFTSLLSLVTSFLLPYTPALMISIPFVILLIIIGKKGIKILGRIAEILFVICLIINVIKTLLLTRYSHYEFFFPMLDNSFSDILLASLIYAVLSSAPFLLFIDQKISAKENSKNYLICSTISLAIVINIISVLGEPLAKLFSFPEYVVLRKIKFFNFLENIENLIAGIWLVDLFITQSMVITKLKDVLKKQKYLPYIILIGSVFIVNKYIINNFANIMVVYKDFIYILMIIFTILLLFLIINKKILKNNKN